MFFFLINVTSWFFSLQKEKDLRLHKVIVFILPPPNDLLLAVVVSFLDGFCHVSEGREAWLPGQCIGSQGLQTPASCLSLLQCGQTSDVLPPDQTQCVLKIALPQSCLRRQKGRILQSIGDFLRSHKNRQKVEYQIQGFECCLSA